MKHGLDIEIDAVSEALGVWRGLEACALPPLKWRTFPYMGRAIGGLGVCGDEGFSVTRQQATWGHLAG